MARSARQSKILDIIQAKEIETQDDLVRELRALNYDITQATISRDIKELGLIKIMTDSKKYKYAYVDSSEQQVSSKFMSIYKEAIISIKTAQNLVVVKTLKGISSAVSGFIDKLNLKNVMGTTYGDETVMIICPTNIDAEDVCDKLLEMF
ncbi:MAG: arginine repressor [Christensenellales bacterium]